MTLRIGRTAPRVGGIALTLALAACASAPSRTPAALVQAVEAKAVDGRFDSAWEAARTYERFNDPRAVGWYERAAKATPWTFHNPQAEEALGRIWTDASCCTATARTWSRAPRCAPRRAGPSAGTAPPPSTATRWPC